jgi:hypothetical protein
VQRACPTHREAYGRSGLGKSAIGEPMPELIRCAYAVIDNGGVDLLAADLIGITRQPKPHVLDLEHRSALIIGDRVTQRLVPRRDVLMKIVQPERKVEAPDAGAANKLEREVIPLLLNESSWASVSPFVSIVEADHPRKLHDSRDQVQDISWTVVGSDKQSNIKIAPAHQVGDVAPRYLQRADVGEDPRLVQLVEERSRLQLQRRLPGSKFLVGSGRRHDRRC